MRKIIIFYFLTLNFYLHAQINISWQKCLGGSDNEIGQSVIITSDGDFVTCGWTYSNDGDVSGNHGSQDVWISKISSTGILQWQKCFGGTGNEAGLSIQQTTDGGFIFTAT